MINDRIEHLRDELVNALVSKKISYSETLNLHGKGIYVVYENDEIIYVGKTSRTGKVRLRELASDYRSHTLNRKLLAKYIDKKTGLKNSTLNKDSKRRLIDNGILSEEEFVSTQSMVNRLIRSELMFQFHTVDEVDLNSMEHFAIAVLNPRMND